MTDGTDRCVTFTTQVSPQTCRDEVKKAVNEAERRREKGAKNDRGSSGKQALFLFIKSFQTS
jgi:hypothetical protein